VTARKALYPNLFVTLVAPPAVGKSVLVDEVKTLWRKIDNPKLHLAPNDMTGASLIDALASAQRTILLRGPENDIMEYHSLLIAAAELGVLLPEYDNIKIALLCDLYDNPPHFEQTRRTNKLKHQISSPNINILAGCTPGYLAGTFPELAWTTGFSSRNIMVYSALQTKVKLFEAKETVLASKAANVASEGRLLAKLSEALELHGEVLWTDGAIGAIERWADLDCKPVPTHSKLQTYNGRRLINCIKLCMLSAVSRNSDLLIEQQDFERAQSWLLQAEFLMPDIFRDMMGKSDSDVLQELHFTLWQKWIKDRTPIHESFIYHYLHNKIPSEKIGRVIDVGERSNMLRREAGTQLWIPLPRHEHGME
jgi:hypothetical protein